MTKPKTRKIANSSKRSKKRPNLIKKLLSSKKIRYGLLIFVLLIAGIGGYAAFQGLNASAAECRQSTVTSQVHLTNTSLLFENSSDVAFCVGGAKGKITMTIYNSNQDNVWHRSIDAEGLPKAPNYKTVKPDVALPTGMYSFALLDRATNKRIDASFGITGSIPTDDPYFGMNTHYIKGKTSGTDGRADLAKTYPQLEQIGMSSVRETLAWNTIEKSKEVYKMPGTYVDDFMDTAKKNRDPVIFVAAYSNALYTSSDSAPPVSDSQTRRFAKYISYVLDKYPQITHVEIYNEYDHVADKTKNSSNRGTGAEYASMFKKTTNYLRNMYGKTKVKVVAGSISTLAGSSGEVSQSNDIARFTKWWSDFGANGGFAQADALSFHRYDDTMPSDENAYHKRLDAIVKRYNSNNSKPIVVSEVGLTTADTPQWRGVVVNQRDQASGLVRTYLGYMRGSIVSHVLWYDAIDDGVDSKSIEHNWGLFKRPNSQTPYAYQPKWSALSFYWMRRELDEGYKLTKVSQPVQGVQQYTFTKGKSERHVLYRDLNFAANIKGGVDVTINIRKDVNTNVYNMLGERMAAKDKKYSNSKITVRVTTAPTYVNN